MSGLSGTIECRITPCWLHAAPVGISVVPIGSTTPVCRCTARIWLSAKNAIELPSGDQKGTDALVVPGRGRAAVSSSCRSQRLDTPPAVATNTMRRPSGAIANDAGSVVAGVVISSRSSGALRLVALPADHHVNAAAPSNRAAAPAGHGNGDRRPGRTSRDSEAAGRSSRRRSSNTGT